MAKCFISSTSEDLISYRAKARDAGVSVGILPEMMEFFTASGKHKPLAECLAKVSECDVLVVIVRIATDGNRRVKGARALPGWNAWRRSGKARKVIVVGKLTVIA